MAYSLFLRGVRLKVPGLAVSIDLAVLLKDSSILSCSVEVLCDDGIYAGAQLLVVWVSPVRHTTSQPKVIANMPELQDTLYLACIVLAPGSDLQSELCTVGQQSMKISLFTQGR